MQNMSDKEKKLWLLDHMFLKDKSEKWSMLFMMLGSQKLTYKETTDAIEEFQTKIDLAEANANAKNVTVAFAKTDKKKKYEDDLKWLRTFYANHLKGGKGGGGKNSSRGNGKGRDRGKGSGKGGKGKSKGKKTWGSSGRGSGKDAIKKAKEDVGKAHTKCWSCGEVGHRQADCTWTDSFVGMANLSCISEEETNEYSLCILGIWCMVIIICVSLLQIVNAVKHPSGIFT